MELFRLCPQLNALKLLNDFDSSDQLRVSSVFQCIARKFDVVIRLYAFSLKAVPVPRAKSQDGNAADKFMADFESCST